ncbi:hypothetical protein LOZ53_002848 [Ophidiomyces ophidiicola]|uniref:Uncharacterized protein n=1 Tax=Ophidiomyces ophidiicola TaxID=1387563 RepID=A0ACB8UU67_9EURO|nr:hypothetical protein LOZ62_004298 [Ophidiomyces ophidiicola]KAI1970381.1 hypothetical protein LOZ56_003761 [Ophidiomyces ophidiicola]KAI1974357.1 hypothetical protein LOZ55_005056 [Ophidiomyces ophidiicola]KAI1982640.1 hypothetical protein LOZ54_005326 [Ophidiomyces ophidiicola]KAI1991534.1 hypothetical protein LOZ53_002848 [Ophidiomyces ophidiicola]
MGAITRRIRRLAAKGELDQQTADVMLSKVPRILKTKHLYQKIRDTATSSFTAEDLKEDFDIIFWDDKKPLNKPIFFKQLSENFLTSHYKVPCFKRHGPSEDTSGAQFCYNLTLDLSNFLGGMEAKVDGVTLQLDSDWKNDRALYNNSSILEYDMEGGKSKHRYEWMTLLICGRPDLPHTLVTSRHMVHDPSHILRSELMIILRVLYTKTKECKWAAHKTIPVLLVSMRGGQFRVIEAYHGDSKVVLRYSNPITMPYEENATLSQAKMSSVVRWMFSDPVGNTLASPQSAK